MHLIGGQLSSGNSIAMTTAKRFRMGTLSGLVTYCVIFTGTHIAYAATHDDAAFVYGSFYFVTSQLVVIFF